MTRKYIIFTTVYGKHILDINEIIRFSQDGAKNIYCVYTSQNDKSFEFKDRETRDNVFENLIKLTRPVDV